MGFASTFLSRASMRAPGRRSGLGRSAAALLLAAACGDGDEDTSLSCDEPADLVAYVDAAMREYYYWNVELPDVDLADYDSPEQLLDALRYEEDRWSTIFSKPDIDDFYAGRSVGLGIRMVWAVAADQTYSLRISLVYEESPAKAAGLERGMTVLGFNDKTLEEIEADDLWGTIMGAEEPGVEVTLRVATVDGTEFDVVVAKAELLRTSVFLTEVLPVDERRVGYIMFEQFIEPSQDALATAFRQLAAGGATDLVLDLRYNTGGLLDVTRYLASLIAGSRYAGDTFLLFQHNARQRRHDQRVDFGSYTEAIGFDRVAFLVSGSTASASEALINGLRPYVDVHLVGFNTLGKPVGSNPYVFCDKVLQPITFALKNAEGDGGYFEGIAPDCAVDDDLDFQLGEPGEARLAAAISWLRGDPCPAHIVANDGGALTLPHSRAFKRYRDPLLRGPGVAGYYGVF